MRIKELVVEFNGQSIGDDEFPLLSQVRVQQKLSLPTLCEFAFLTGPSSQFYRRMPIGASAVVRVATHDASGILFEGEITAVEHIYNSDEGPHLRIRAYDGLHRLRKQQRVKAYADVSLDALAGQLLRDAGLRGSVAIDESLPPLKWQRIIQSGQTHFDFLVEQCTAVGVHFIFRDKTLSLLTLRGTGTPVPLVLGDTLREASFEINGNLSARSCNAASWNPRRAEVQVGATDRPRVGRKVKASAAPDRVGGMADFHLRGSPAEDVRQATALAQAELDFRAAGEVIFRGVAMGSSSLRPGVKVRIDEVAAEVAGEYVLTEVTHVMTGERGYTSELTSQPPEPIVRAKGTIAALGRVSKVDDPEGFGRIQVLLPAYDDAETDWMQVVVPGAGRAKGFIALPDVGDSVLVLCPNENLAHGIVLGGLFGMQRLPDSGVERGKTQRFSLHTSGGHLVSLDDDKNILRIAGSQGSYLEFAPSGVRLHCGAKLDIEAPGQPITVTGSSIDFKTG